MAAINQIVLKNCIYVFSEAKLNKKEYNYKCIFFYLAVRSLKIKKKKKITTQHGSSQHSRSKDHIIHNANHAFLLRATSAWKYGSVH